MTLRATTHGFAPRWCIEQRTRPSEVAATGGVSFAIDAHRVLDAVPSDCQGASGTMHRDRCLRRPPLYELNVDRRRALHARVAQFFEWFVRFSVGAVGYVARRPCRQIGQTGRMADNGHRYPRAAGDGSRLAFLRPMLLARLEFFGFTATRAGPHGRCAGQMRTR